MIRKKIADQISHEYRYKNPQPNISKFNLRVYKRIIHHSQMKFIPSIKCWLHFKNSINVIYYINRLKEKNHKIIPINAEKVFDKIQYPLMVRIVSKIGIQGNFLNLLKNIYQEPIANILNDDKLKVFLLRSGRRQGCPLTIVLTLY